MRRDASGWSIRFDPAEAAALRAAGIWRNRTIGEDAQARAAGQPDRIFLTEGRAELTYGSALAGAERLAAGLWSLGLRPGDVVSFQLPNWHEAVLIDLAAALLGLVVNPIVPIYRDAEVGLILADCRAKVVFVPGSFRNFDYPAMLRRLRPQLPELKAVVVLRAEAGPQEVAFEELQSAGATPPWPQVAPESVKMVMYTSGTTGKAKGVLHSHETLPRALHAGFVHWGLEPGDVVIMPSPIGHVTGFTYGLEMPFYEGTRSLLMERWNADEAVALIDRHGAAFTVGATPFLQELLDAAERAGSRLPSMKIFACGGAAVPPSLIRRANALLAGGRAVRCYGSTEAPVITQGFVGADQGALAADTDGEIVDYEVRIVDDEGQPLADGREGEILARGPALTRGYADPEQTAEAFDAEGFFRTGDIGYRTAGKGIVITGRKKDLIIRGGENLSAKEIEDALHRHAAVKEAAAVSMPHPRLGETVCAYVIPSGARPPTLPELVEFLQRQGLARQKYPERLEVVEDFPRTASGKIRKDQLRAAIAAKLTKGA